MKAKIYVSPFFPSDEIRLTGIFYRSLTRLIQFKTATNFNKKQKSKEINNVFLKKPCYSIFGEVRDWFSIKLF